MLTTFSYSLAHTKTSVIAHVRSHPRDYWGYWSHCRLTSRVLELQRTIIDEYVREHVLKLAGKTLGFFHPSQANESKTGENADATNQQQGVPNIHCPQK
jgi:hypothetical protein